MRTTAAHAFAGVVPSAGSSRRMGRSKALLELDDATFVHRAVRSLAGGGCEPILVVVATGEDAVAAEARRAGARVLHNPDPGEGPITSLRLALAEVGARVEGIVYLPVDHPLVRPETVALLLYEARASDAPIVLPVHEGRRGHPAVFRAELFAELADPGLEGGARTVVHGHLAAARLVEVDDPGVLADIDTPEAYADLLGAAPPTSAPPPARGDPEGE